MRPLILRKPVLAGLTAAGALAGGVLISPVTHADPVMLLQPKPTAPITVSGTALNPDGSPGAKLPAAVQKQQLPQGGGVGGGGAPPPPDMLASQPGGANSRYQTIGRVTTDDSGKFEVKNIREPGSLRLAIGDRERTPWIVQTIRNEGKNIDVGQVKLRDPVGSTGRGKGKRKGK